MRLLNSDTGQLSIATGIDGSGVVLRHSQFWLEQGILKECAALNVDWPGR